MIRAKMRSPCRTVSAAPPCRPGDGALGFPTGPPVVLLRPLWFFLHPLCADHDVLAPTGWTKCRPAPDQRSFELGFVTLPLPKPPPRATTFLRRLQFIHQPSVAPLFQIQLLLERSNLFLQAAYPFLGQRHCRASGLPVARQVVVQHYVHPVPPSARFPSYRHLPGGDAPVQCGQRVDSGSN